MPAPGLCNTILLIAGNAVQTGFRENILDMRGFGFMLVEDHRYVSCGGDPFNYLKSTLKGLYFQLEPGQDAQIMLLKEKFPYDRNTFEGMVRTSKLALFDYNEGEEEVSLFVRRTNS